MWGTWHAAAQPDDSVITLSDQEETLEFFGDTFYTQMQVIWNLSPYAMAFGVWAGIDPSRCDSTGHLNLNVLLKAQTSQANELSLRTKVKDARGSLFYQDQIVTVGTWQRLTVPFADLWLESGVAPLTHPLQAVDFGISSNPPATGVLWFTDLKFDDHVKFSGANRLRVLEFKMEQQGLPTQELWLDEVGLNLVAADPFPYTPRLAISLTPYGQNPWRGPTLVHYAQPLAPHLAGALNLSQTYVGLHREAQNEFFRRYRGVKGAILPVHTRNDVENIALCGEENFGAFCWWPARRGFGKVVASFPFNGSLQDAAREHHLTWSPGSPVYTGGICQPGQTALMFNGSGGQASCPGHEDFLLGKGDFTLEAIASFASLSSSHVLMSFWNQGNSQRSWAMLRAGKNLALHYSVTGSDYPIILAVGDLIASPATYYHLLIVRSGETVSFYVNGQVAGSGYIGSASFYPAQAQFRLGRWEYSGYLFSGNLDFVQIHKGRAMNPAEIADRWRIIQGQQNGSAYPEAGYALAQYWAFYRLAQYFFVTNDPATWDILSTWLTWLDAYGAPDGAGWQFPTYFSKYGFGYGAYDPGVTASLALGCLYIYLRNGDSRASLWARRILDDLRLHRQSLEYGGGYKSDYHYAWLNALVAQAFGLAAVGRAGEAYNFPNLPEDTAHFQSLIAWMFKHSGDVKPNLLNTDLIPFTYLEDTEVWEYAPHYVFMRQMGSLEAVVLMAGAALDYGKLSGDWTWFDRLLRFVLTDNLMRLSPAQIRDLALSYDLAGLKNRVRLRFADYDRDNSKYAEVQDQAAITAWGEQAVDLDCRYGRPVILENPDTAKLLADRLLKRLSTPWETVELTTWLEGLRTELGDTVAISSDFHGLAAEEFTVHGKAVDLARRQVHLSLARPVQTAWSWAVDADGSPYDSSAIDQPCSLDSNWPYRSYAG
jgi:hypothetical protein